MMKNKKACIAIGSFSIGIGIVLVAISIAFGGFPAAGSMAELRREISERFGGASRDSIDQEYPAVEEAVTHETVAEASYGGSMSWKGSQYDIPDLYMDTLIVNLDHSSIEIVQGDAFQIETDVDSNINCYLDNGELQIEEEGSWIEFSPKKGLKNNASKVKVTLMPYQLSYLEISTGAGNIKISDLDAQQLIISAGAGTVKADNVTAAISNLDLGAGNVSFTNFLGKEQTEINSGVGSVKIEGSLLNNTIIEGGVGTLDLNLRGNVNDYVISAESSMGSVKVNGNKVSSFLEEAYETHSGSNSLYVEGGVGNVDIRFKD